MHDEDIMVDFARDCREDRYNNSDGNRLGGNAKKER